MISKWKQRIEKYHELNEHLMSAGIKPISPLSRDDKSVLVRVLAKGHGLRFALPSPWGNITLRKEDVLYLPLRAAAILERGGYAEIMRIENHEREVSHELGISQSENMANVES